MTSSCVCARLDCVGPWRARDNFYRTLVVLVSAARLLITHAGAKCDHRDRLIA